MTDIGSHPTFRCRIEHETDGLRVELTGALDLAAVPVLERHLVAALTLPLHHLRIDLRHLSFLDSAGLSVLMRARQAAADRHIAFSVTNPSEPVEWLLALTGLASLSSAGSA